MAKTLSKIKLESEKLLSLAPCDWGKFVDKYDPSEISQAECDADHICQHAARLSGYLDCRALGYSHKEALDESQENVKKVRKALGYTFP